MTRPLAAAEIFKQLLDESVNVIILSGAGMSQELGTKTYWTGDDAKYASHQSEYGYTSLEHSTAALWDTDLPSQMNYFHSLYLGMLDQQNRKLSESSYSLLLDYLNRTGKNYFCVTSNVDSAFQNAGFEPERIYEPHGSYRNSQCLKDPIHGIVPTDPNVLNTPCPFCGAATRPNVMFFYDMWFNSKESQKQNKRYQDFIDNIKPWHTKQTVILEIGVGVTVPTIRNIGNRLFAHEGFPYLHVNPEPEQEALVTKVLEADPPAPEGWLQKTAKEGLLS